MKLVIRGLASVPMPECGIDLLHWAHIGITYERFVKEFSGKHKLGLAPGVGAIRAESLNETMIPAGVPKDAICGMVVHDLGKLFKSGLLSAPTSKGVSTIEGLQKTFTQNSLIASFASPALLGKRPIIESQAEFVKYWTPTEVDGNKLWFRNDAASGSDLVLISSEGGVSLSVTQVNSQTTICGTYQIDFRNSVPFGPLDVNKLGGEYLVSDRPLDAAGGGVVNFWPKRKLVGVCPGYKLSAVLIREMCEQAGCPEYAAKEDNWTELSNRVCSPEFLLLNEWPRRYPKPLLGVPSDSAPPEGYELGPLESLLLEAWTVPSCDRNTKHDIFHVFPQNLPVLERISMDATLEPRAYIDPGLVED